MDQTKKQWAVNTNDMEWEAHFSVRNHRNNFNKYLLDDDDTGMTVRMILYPKGFLTRWHTHPCGHGIYVLKGELYTDKGVYGPGCFVWFPEGVAAEHGATDRSDVEVLFITNKAFDLFYLDDSDTGN